MQPIEIRTGDAVLSGRLVPVTADQYRAWGHSTHVADVLADMDEVLALNPAVKAFSVKRSTYDAVLKKTWRQRRDSETRAAKTRITQEIGQKKLPARERNRAIKEAVAQYLKDVQAAMRWTEHRGKPIYIIGEERHVA